MGKRLKATPYRPKEEDVEEIITMEDMRLVFQVTDALDIDRERMSVSLEKQDPGQVERLRSGEVEITLPLTTPLQEWLPTLRARLQNLGFQEVAQEEKE
ncbi:MAG: hypothetical protein HY685_01370 [Chloroflexi bacterium]|nr:hypothetical protein [Chloroflexota bacterium]